MLHGRWLLTLALVAAAVVGLERVVAVQPEFLWRERTAANTCPVYRSLYAHLSSYGSKVFFRSGTGYWRDTAAASVGDVAPGLGRPYPAPTTFERTGTGDADGRNKEQFTVDTSAYFAQVTAARKLFIRHCFDAGQALFFDGIGWLDLREAIFGTYDIRLWDVTPVGISPDGRYALVYAENHCGFLCGLGEFYLFEQRNGQWVLAGSSLRFIS